MAKKRIIVGREYADAFDAIRKLINGGCIKGGNSASKYKVVGNIIEDDAYEYELSASSGVKADDSKFVFGADGASWFKGLRDNKVENDEAIWTTLIESISEAYHERYSVVEYDKQYKTDAEKTKDYEKCVKVASEFVKIFYSQFDGGIQVKPSNAEEIEDIYGVSMRIELSGGTGESVPILGKVYFSKDGDDMKAIKGSVAYNIDENLAKIVPDEVDERETELPTASVDKTFKELDELIKSPKLNFADYLCYGDKRDVDAVENLLEKLSHDNMEIVCTRIDALYVSRIKSLAFVSDVYFADTPLFRIKASIDGSVTISCLNCTAGEALVNRNVIEFVNASGVKTSVIINPELESLGLNSEQIALINENAGFSNHFKKICCVENPRYNNCTEFKCASQLVNVKIGTKTVEKCSDCPYPEVIYTDGNGVKRYTKGMIFAKDKMELIESEETKICNVCGRAFSKNKISSGNCVDCNKLLLNLPNANTAALYKKYKQILPLSVRIFGVFSEKSCYEDEEMALIRVGNSVYAFNKLNVKEKGLIKGPKLVKRS